MPDLLQQQIGLGRFVQREMGIRTAEQVSGIIRAVLGREKSWLDFYGDNIEKGLLESDKVDRAEAIERRLVEAAKAEAEYALACWEGDPNTAREVLENAIEETARADTPLAGWHSVWLGGLYQAAGDHESAGAAYRRARVRLGPNIILPKLEADVDLPAEPVTAFAASIFNLVGLNSPDTYSRELRLLERRLRDLDGGATPAQTEEAGRALGEFLGFEAFRPDNDSGTGPDVAWEEPSTKTVLALELKTDKTEPARYGKKDVGQGHDSLAWLAREKSEHTRIGLAFVGPDGRCTDDANPSEDM